VCALVDSCSVGAVVVVVASSDSIAAHSDSAEVECDSAALYRVIGVLVDVRCVVAGIFWSIVAAVDTRLWSAWCGTEVEIRFNRGGNESEVGSHTWMIWFCLEVWASRF